MPMPVEALEAEVLRLPTLDRARLLDRLVASLDADRARDQAWDALAAKRDEQAAEDGSLVVAGPEALARLRAELA